MIILYLLYGFVIGMAWFGVGYTPLALKIGATVAFGGVALVQYLMFEKNLLVNGFQKNGKKLSFFELYVVILGWSCIPVILGAIVWGVLSLIL